MKKRLIGIALASVMTIGFAASASAAEYNWVGAIHLPETTTHTQALQYFADQLKEKSDGRIEMTVSPGGALGSQREIVEAVDLGTIQVGFGECSVYSNYDEVFGVMNLPFLFSDYEQLYAACDGEMGDYFEELLAEKTNIKILNWLNGGARMTYSTKELQSWDDFGGLKIRTPESNVYVSTFTALGANPTPIAMTEVYSSLQQGVVEAMEGTLETGISYQMYEVCDYMLESRHIFADCQFIINEDVYNSLPDDLKEIVDECAADAEKWERETWEANEMDYLTQLEDEGVTVHEIDNADAKEAVQSFYDEYIGGDENKQKVFDMIAAVTQ